MDNAPRPDMMAALEAAELIPNCTFTLGEIPWA